MPSPWEQGFQRMADVVRAAAAEAVRQRQAAQQPPVIQQGPRPPLVISPQVGPVEQMIHRSLRERGLGPEAWQIAKQTPVRMVPMEQYTAERGGGGANYDPSTAAITMGYYPGYLGGEGDRIQYTHELRHSAQDRSESPVMPNSYNDNTAYMRDMARWASTEPKAQAVIDSVRGGIDSGVYTDLNPWEIDARVAADQHIFGNAPQTYENLPDYMKPYYENWWESNARPDPIAARQRMWSEHLRPGWK